MADFDFKSTGARVGDRLRQTLIEQEVRRRQGLLDGLAVQSQLQEQARFENAARRQAQLDAQHVKQQALENTRNDRDFAARQEAAQLARVANADQNAQSMFTLSANMAQKERERAADTEEGEKRRQHELRRDAINNASDERRTAMGSSGSSAGKMTEGARKTDGLLYRAQAARGNVEMMEDGLNLWEMVAPGWGTTSQGRRYWQAADQWIDSVLRDESGAAIGKDERASYYKTYFAQPNDDPDTIEQKRQARDAAEEAMSRKTGNGRNGGDTTRSNAGGSKYKVSVR